MNHNTKLRNFNSGFTLVEMALVVLIISLIIGGVMTVENQKIRRSKITLTNQRIEVIGKALYRYRIVNNQLPCPGNAALASSNANFGVAANGAAETCNTGGSINSNINSSGNDVFGGTLPVRTLGLADEYAFDGWGNKFTYFIDKKTNNSANFTGISKTDGVSLTGKLVVRDESNTAISAEAFAVVVSHGPNGLGAYTASGTRKALPDSGSVEYNNCLCDTPATTAIHVGRAIAASSTNNALNNDDIVTYYPRNYFYTYAERNP